MSDMSDVVWFTGGHGCLGRYIYEAFAKKYKKVLRFHRSIVDLRNKTDIETVLNDYKPSIIVHVAGNASNSSDSSDVITDNILATDNLLNCIDYPCRLLYASSITVYGTAPTHCGEDFGGESSQLKPSSRYAIAKTACEQLIKAKTRRENMTASVLRLSAVCGGGFKHGLVADIVRKLQAAQQTNSHFISLYGPCPGSVKPYLYAGCAAEAFLHFARNWWSPYDVFNVSATNVVSVETVASHIMNEMGIYKKIDWIDGNWPSDNPKLWADTRLASACGFHSLNSYESIRCAVHDIMCGAMK